MTLLQHTATESRTALEDRVFDFDRLLDPAPMALETGYRRLDSGPARRRPSRHAWMHR
jgi:hypothetical protein